MGYIIIKRTLPVCLFLLAALPLSPQGLYWESMTTGRMFPDTGRTSKFYYMPKMFKTVTSDAGDGVILRFDKELLITLSPKDKTYSEASFAEIDSAMKRVSSEMDEQMSQMQEQLKDLPEEQRKMVEKMMGDKMSGKKAEAHPEVIKTGDSRSISGYACTKYLLKQGEKVMMTVWATKDVKEFEVMRKDLEEFSRRMLAMNPMAQKAITDAMKHIDGFPVERDMGGDMKEVVTKIEKKSIASGEFEIPSGYKRVDSPLMKARKGNEQ
jgi:hypothetical protein